MVSESRQRTAIFLTFEFFCVRAGFGVEELHRVICSTEEHELAAVVEVDGGVVRRGRGFEEACWAEGRYYVGDFCCAAHLVETVGPSWTARKIERSCFGRLVCSYLITA